MLVLRRQQLQALRDELEGRFVDRLCRQFARKPPDPEHPADRETLRPLVRDAIDKARSYGIDREWDIYRYTLLQLKHGADFEQRPAMAWAREILTRADYDSTQKMDSLAYRIAVGGS